MPAKKPRKIINGEEYIQCAVKTCGRWIKFEEIKNRSYRCNKCWIGYKKEYERKRKEKGYVKNRDIANTRKQAMIDKELRGEIPIGDLFSGVSEEKIKALQRYDVEALLRSE